MNKKNISTFEKNRIFLERKRKLIIEMHLPQNDDNLPLILSMCKNIEDLGFVFSESLFQALKHLSSKEIIELYKQIVPILRKIVGAHVKHKPFYKNFPQQVASMSELELYLNALVHYWSDGEWVSSYKDQLRFPLIDSRQQVKVIDLATSEDFDQFIIDILTSGSSLSERDVEIIQWYIKNEDPKKLVEILPDDIRFKETLSIVLSNLFIEHPNQISLLTKYIKTSTDLLRLISVLSGGESFLSANTKFRNFSRSERRTFLNLLNELNNIEEDMKKYKEQWIRLGEKLHPGDYSDKYPNAYKAFTNLRRNLPVFSFYSDLENALLEEDFDKAIYLLKKRPGEFARKLDHLIRVFPDSAESILEGFTEVASSISTRVLLQVIAHFKNRDIESEYRSFFPKGNVAKVKVIQNNLERIPDFFSHGLVKIANNELINRFKNKDKLGKVYVDPALSNVFVPLTLRSSSHSAKTFERGSRFVLPEGDYTIRAFIHWKNAILESEGYRISSRTDVDLSVGFYNEEWEYMDHVSYTNLKSKKTGVYHSGDIVDAPNGASEFIDIDVKIILDKSIRYAVFNVYSYSRQTFDKIPECFFGWMYRDYPESGEIFEPKLVENKIDLTSNSVIALPLFVDFKEMKAIWMDVALRSRPYWYNNIEVNNSNVVLISQGVERLNKPTLFDLFSLHALARGELVENADNADIKFGLDELTNDITPFDTEMILADYL